MSFPAILNPVLSARATYRGLTAEEAQNRQKEFGFNERARGEKKKWFRRLWNIISEPMMALILLTGIISFFIGEKNDAILLFFSVIPILFFEYLQESKTDNAIAALDKMMVDFCRAYRDGKMQELEARELVPGDLVYLTAGDKVPADGFVLESPGLMVDESMLTGEAIGVVKAELPHQGQDFKEENHLSQGTLVTQGEGYLLVSAIGANTAYGKLGNLLSKITAAETPLQKKIEKLVKGVAVVAIGVAVTVGVIITFTKGWESGVMGGLTMAMALVPEEFPVVFSVFLIMGVWRMSKQNALVREMKMVETLGSATVICTDKTGTLTEGQMSLVKIYNQNNLFDLSNSSANSNLKEMVEALLLALERVAVDPIEIEVQKFAQKNGEDLDKFFGSRTLLSDSTFSAVTKMVHHVWREKNGECYQYSAGAPEAVIGACDLSENEKEKYLSVNAREANLGLRVVAVAKRKCEEAGEVELNNLEFVGLLIMSDPPRAGVKEAIETCQKAGIKIIMITGDNKLTAHSIAESVGLEHNEEIFSGAEIEQMSQEQLQTVVKTHSIFARVKPEHKYRIIEALQTNGEVVAMTGDGVNDAPALKKSNIGIAMGKKGTEVARSASGIVLLDDNFATIVNAVKEGRRIYDNMRQAFVFLFSFHLPIIGLALIPLILNQPLIFLPIHIIFLELFCDPVSVLGFERERARRGLMNEPPRPVNEPLINPRLWWQVIWQGVGIFAVSFAFYYYFGMRLGNQELGRTLAFAVLVWSQVLLVILSRQWHQIKTNRLMWVIVLGLTVSLFLGLNIPVLRGLFHFSAVPFYVYPYLIAVPLFVVSAVLLLVVKGNLSFPRRRESR